jgi:hypothetical protein
MNICMLMFVGLTVFKIMTMVYYKAHVFSKIHFNNILSAYV